MPFSHLGVVLRWRPRELKATGKHVDHRRHTPFGYMGKGYATEIALRRVNVRLDGSTRFPLSALRRLKASESACKKERKTMRV